MDPSPTTEMGCGRETMIAAVLAITTLALFSPVSGFEFNNYDDAQYIVNNIHVKTGLTPANILWAFTSGYASNWHPLTWLSHMLDCHLYGLRSGAHHMTNVLIHTANTLLLFGLWRRMTGHVWRSAFVAALFAWHPMHVESVAFVAERKDVLSAFFGFATLWAYWRYVQIPNWRRYSLVAAGLALGLMSKPMLVTLPVLMLLLDFWPLRREWSLRRLILEKTPLLGLCALSSIVTVWAQKTGGAVAPISALPVTVRFVTALNAYANYIGKLFWPTHLSAFYPYRYHIPWIRTLASGALVLVVSLAVWRQARRRPYATVGWFWFLIALLPVIGLIQVGNQSMADRYTYIPAIGLFVLVTWEAAERTAGHPGAKRLLGAVAVMVLVACAIVTSRQLAYWRNSAAIFTHALEVTPGNAFAECSLGVVLLNENRTDDAIAHFRAALQLEPYFDRAVANLGLAYLDEGKIDAATTNLLHAVQLASDNPYAQYGLARALDAQNKLDEAIPHYLAAVKINPDIPEAQVSLGAVLISQGKPQLAEAHFAAALLANPNMWEAQFQYGNALLIQGKLPEAETHYREAARLNPQSAYAELNLAVALERQGKAAEGAVVAERALQLATRSGDTALANQLRAHLDSLRAKKDAKPK